MIRVLRKLPISYQKSYVPDIFLSTLIKDLQGLEISIFNLLSHPHWNRTNKFVEFSVEKLKLKTNSQVKFGGFGRFV